MRNKASITLILIIIAAGFWLTFLKEKPLSNNTITTAQTNNIKEKKSPKTKNKTVKINKKNNSLQPAKEIQNDLIQQQFSTEPFIELISVAKLLNECSLNKDLSINLQPHSIKREKSIMEYRAKCSKLKDDYPAISDLGNGSGSEMMLMNYALQSKYADLIQKGLSVKYMDEEKKQQFTQEAIKAVINSENALIIATLDLIIQSTNSHEYFNQLSRVLGTINLNYTRLIISQSTTLFSCQYNEGISCSPAGEYMLKQCYKDENACGLDVETWFVTSLTPAHNRDINKLIIFFENQLH